MVSCHIQHSIYDRQISLAVTHLLFSFPLTSPSPSPVNLILLHHQELLNPPHYLGCWITESVHPAAADHDDDNTIPLPQRNQVTNMNYMSQHFIHQQDQHPITSSLIVFLCCQPSQSGQHHRTLNTMKQQFTRTSRTRI